MVAAVRYQIFVSSTYADLENERAKVFNSLMMMDCIPAGMEFFTAFDEEQLEFIKTVINDSDYYVLIIGGRYGSLTVEGISFTEKEYDYAISIGKPVLAFLHSNPDIIPQGKTDKDSAKALKLDQFKEKIRTAGRNVKTWSDPSELATLVTLSLQYAIKTKPAIGWIRGNTAASIELLTELNQVKNQYRSASEQLATLKQQQESSSIQNLAGLDEQISIRFDRTPTYSSPQHYRLDQTFTWQELFSIISPHFISPHQPSHIQNILNTYFKEVLGSTSYKVNIIDEDINLIKIQFNAYGFMKLYSSETVKGGLAEFMALTDIGQKELMNIKSVKTKNLAA